MVLAAGLTLVVVACGATPPVETSSRGTSTTSSGTSTTSHATSTTSPGPTTSPTESVALGVSLTQFIFAPDGKLVMSDCGAARVYSFDTAGLVTLAGSGSGGMGAGFGGDGKAATEAQLECPHGLVYDTAGSLYVTDHGNNRIRVIDAQGIIQTIAGGGESGTGDGVGDDGPAIEAVLDQPTWILFDLDGNLYISDRNHDRVRMVDTSGLIHTIAGTGVAGFGGDEGPATEAMIDDPAGLAFDAEGNLIFADSNNRRLRKITPGGTISTIAGTGDGSSSGDGGPALAAGMGDPEGVAIDAAGNIYVGEAEANRVRRIDVGGLISAFAGTGQEGYSGDGGPAVEATLRVRETPVSLWVDAAGNVYIADSVNNAIRMVDVDGVITTYFP